MKKELITQDLNKIEFDHQKWKAAMPAGISRRKVAQALGVTDSNLISIELGHSKPSLMLAFKYCAMVNLPIEDLAVDK